MPTTLPPGLTEVEARRRHAAGQGNDARLPTSRSYADILRANVLTFINLVLFGIGALLALLGLYTDALLSVSIAALNVIVGVVQEVRAKRVLDRIALLTRPQATVIRDGRERMVDPAEVVVGDALVVRPGDQFVADGVVLALLGSALDVDESLLTGESDRVAKNPGDPVYAGSYCMAGGGVYEARQVGLASFANQIALGGRAFRQAQTPLQRDVDLMVRLLVVVSIQIAVLFAIQAVVQRLPFAEGVRIAAVITGLIPNGLFFMISAAYGMGAVRMAGRGVLVQRANAVESLSNVDILCLDKTGTLTANRLRLHALQPLNGLHEEELRRLLSLYAASEPAGSRTTDALRAALPGAPQPVYSDLAFSAAQGWGALVFDLDGARSLYVLGAPDKLAAALAPGFSLDGQVAQWAERGLRVLLLARADAGAALAGADGVPRLPPGLIPLGLASFSDELRPEARAALAAFASAGIQVKIISGDHPQTALALARQAGLDGEARAIAGSELDGLSADALAEAAEKITIFGRIAPRQKEQLVAALQARGRYVAMIGDGVNDVLSLKQAHLGIALQGGSAAARGAADMVLMDDSFAALPAAFSEGQRIINGMLDILRLFLTRVVYQALIIIGAPLIGVGFPFTPVNTSLLTLFTVGLPTLALAAWARPGPPPRDRLREVARFVLPAGFSLGLAGLLVYTGFYTGQMGAGAAPAEAVLAAQTALTTLLIAGGLLLVVFVEPPTAFWAGGDAVSGDRRPAWLALLLLAAYGLLLAVPELRALLELAPLSPVDILLLAAVLAVWALALRSVWRARLLERFLRLRV